MIKKLLLLAAALLCWLQGNAQTTKDEILAEVNKAGGNYYPYPTPSGKYTPAPEGYTPFYISHYGRHGARFMSEDKDVKNAIKFLKAYQLNELGEKTLAQLEKVDLIMKGKTGELTPLGYQQLREIAHRMYANYPTLLGGHTKVEARSTYIPRSIVSMSTFCLELQSQNSQLDITPIVSNTDMPMLNKDRVKNPNRPKAESKWYEGYLKFCNQKRTSDNRLVESLLMPKQQIKKANCQSFGHSLFNVACAIQDMPGIDFSLFGLFTGDEIWDYWQAQNAFWYGFCGVYGTPNIRAKEFGEELWTNIVNEADAALAGSGKVLDLRFGHDTGMLPIMVYMGINDPIKPTASLNDLYTNWADFKVIPMAANLQFVFYKNNEGDALVKILVNEEEATLPMEAETGPYYNWKKVKAFYKK